MKLILTVSYSLILLFVPYHLIQTYQDVEDNGSEYNFEVRLYDPYDIFRGKYLNIRYLNDNISSFDFNHRKGFFYVEIDQNEQGYAYISQIHENQPEQIENYLKVQFLSQNPNISTDTMRIRYGFTKYFMNEDKIARAEKIFNQAIRDTNKRVYAIIRIKSGYGVLTHIMIDNEDLMSLVDKEM